MGRKYIPQQRIGANGLEWFFTDVGGKEAVYPTYKEAEEVALFDDMWNIVEGVGEGIITDFLIHLGHEYGFDPYERVANWLDTQGVL